MASIREPANTRNPKFQRVWLLKLGSVAALTLSALFVLGLTGLGMWASLPTPAWLAALQTNWLIVLFRLNVTSAAPPADSLALLNELDVFILALSAIVFLSLFSILRQTSSVWSAIAMSLPFLGIIVFLITHTAGRSGLLIGGLIFSLIMLASNTFGRGSAYVGIASSVLLFFAGDLGTAIFSPSIIIAALIGFGYLLWVAWFFLIGRRLFQLARSIPQP